MRSIFLFAILATALAWHVEAGGGKLGPSDTKVKASATATKPSADGKQAVTITLDIAKGWHLYANPVNHNKEFLNGNKTVVKLLSKGSLKVKYPEGKTKTDKSSDGEQIYDVYAGVVKIQANVVREKGDTSPLEITVLVSACDKDVCLRPGTVKLTIP